MRIEVNESQKHLRPFIEQLPALFDAGGTVLYAKRNTIKCFDLNGERIVVKRFGKPGLFNRIVYTYIRRSKARRSYEHAMRLRLRGIDSPEPVAWSEYHGGGLLGDSYYICRYSDYRPLDDAFRNPGNPAMREVLDAFARFAVGLHEKGILHRDFNQGNILWQFDPAGNDCRFQLIDVNRMDFANRPQPPRASMASLRRLNCNTETFLYILDRYAEARGWDVDDTMLHGTFFRLTFRRRQQMKKRFKERRAALASKKHGL